MIKFLIKLFWKVVKALVKYFGGIVAAIAGKHLSALPGLIFGGLKTEMEATGANTVLAEVWADAKVVGGTILKVIWG